MDIEEMIIRDKDGDSRYSSEEFDDSALDWIDEYKNEEKQYELFYKEPVDNIKLNFIYVGIDNEVQCVNESSVLLTNNILNKDRLFELITKNKIKNKIRYNLKYLLKFNFCLEPSNIVPYLKDKINENYLTEIKILDDIFFSSTISVMQDLNCLLFVFIEKPKINTDSFQDNKDKDKYKHNNRITRKLLETMRRRKSKKNLE